MRTVFLRKEPHLEAGEFVVEKVIRLPEDAYEEFTQNLLREHDFIRDNADLMFEQSGVWHCILVTGENTDEGILVESEGASYARYSSFVSSVKEIIRQFEEDQKKLSEQIQKESGMQQTM